MARGRLVRRILKSQFTDVLGKVALNHELT